MPRKNKNGEIVFKDYPEFRPNLTPREIFKAGSFGGTYWRPIYSSVTNKKYKNIHKKYPQSWWKGIPEDHLTRSFDNYDKSINTYGVMVGTTLEYSGGLNGTGFVFNNPNANRTCGCGESFSL